MKPTIQPSPQMNRLGTFKWPLRIYSMNRGHTVDVEAPMDTGVACTTLPGRVLRDLGMNLWQGAGSS